MVVRIPLLLVALLMIVSILDCQEVLRIEKEGRLKTWKFYEGDDMYLKSVYSPDDWAKVTILDIRSGKKQLRFDRSVLRVEEILALKPVSRVKRGKAFQSILTTFAAALTVFSLADPLLGREYRWDALIFAGGSATLGLGLNGIISSPFRFDKKHSIRLLDLSPPPPGDR